MTLAVVRNGHEVTQRSWSGGVIDVANPALKQTSTGFALYPSDGATAEIAVYETSPDDHAHGRLLIYQILTSE